MSYESLLIHTCTIERSTSISRDDHNRPVEDWASLHEDEACRYMDMKGKELRIDANVVIADAKFFVGAIDVTEKDRILYDSKYFDIHHVIIRSDSDGEHHRELITQVVK